MRILVFVGQVYLGLFFLYNAYNHFKNRAAIAGFAQMRAVPAPMVTVPLTGLILLGAGLSLLFGYRVVIGAWLAIIFLILVSYYVHHYWTDQGMERVGQQVHFFKNLAIASALLLATFVPKDVWVIRLGP